MTVNNVSAIDRPPSEKWRAISWFQTALLGPFLIVFLTATSVRMAWVNHLNVNSPGSSYAQPFNDAEMGNIATNIAEGRGFSSPFGRGASPTAWECPFVPYLFAGFMKLAGGATGHAANLILLLQVVVGGFAAAVYWLIARRLMIRNPGLFSEWLSPVLAVVVCLWSESVYSSAYLW